MTDPQSEMMRRGWDPADGLNSLKAPLFQTSTFVFESSAAAERLFDVVYGGATPEEGEHIDFIYTRMDHPNLVIVEERLALWDGAGSALLFSSGVSAIFTTLLTFVRPGDLILHSAPLYGGTNTMLHQVLAPLGYEVVSFGPEATEAEIADMIEGRRLGVVYLETPANPTNDVFDIAMAARVAVENSTPQRQVLTIVDNTFLGPYSQRPLEHGADLVVYSATKYFGGHSDLVAGVATGATELIEPLKTMRYRIGTTADPHTAWLLGRSMETYSIRIEKQTANAATVAKFLADHPKVASVRYLGLIGDADPHTDLAKRQWSSGGAMISFDVVGGKAEAFRLLDSMSLIANTTSLGGTESIACHPWTTTHSNVDSETKRRIGVTESMIRLSIGIEAAEDIIRDLENALARV
ncbi:MAG TPA: aminotransferase class I/II-fold pyridoxal phosphate-dependent enzyme [Acidimicrobiia bacterium]|nr:aminotransferase class I/II-fold pyridoxal phosphate-dependent enzyme [Acidimicrobiia bacterium]